MESAKLPTVLTLDTLAGRLTKFPPVLVVPPAPLEATASLYEEPNATRLLPPRL